MRAACESQKPVTKNKKSDQPDGDDTNSEFIPRVLQNKLNTNPGKGKKQNTDRNRGIQHYFYLCKNTRYPQYR